MTTRPLSYGYTWQFPDYTSSNTLYTIRNDGIVGFTNMDGQSLIPLPSMSQLLPVEQTYESSQTRPPPWLGDSYIQDASAIYSLPLHRQQSPQSVSGSPILYRCFDHGCGGRSFSSRSNLRRHQRERARLTKILPCPLCGAKFYRRWSVNQHLKKGSCLRRTPKHLSQLDADREYQYGQRQEPPGHIDTTLVRDLSLSHAPVSPGLIASAPVSPQPQSWLVANNHFDCSWEASSC